MKKPDPNLTLALVEPHPKHESQTLPSPLPEAELELWPFNLGTDFMNPRYNHGEALVDLGNPESVAAYFGGPKAVLTILDKDLRPDQIVGVSARREARK